MGLGAGQYDNEHGKDKDGSNSERVLKDSREGDMVKIFILDKRLDKEITGQDF